MLSTLSVIGLGALLGLRHSVEPDHLAAVSTLVATERNPGNGALLGAIWGLGHTLALLAVGVVLAVLGAELPQRLSELFEFGVALMLIGLGVRAIRRASLAGRSGPSAPHLHSGDAHVHAASGPHLHVGSWTFARRPLLVGIVHGLAGSGSLTALVLAGLPTTAARLTYICLFGLGLVVGMSVISGLAGVPVARLGRSPRFCNALNLATGVTSALLGFFWGLPLLEGWLH